MKLKTLITASLLSASSIAVANPLILTAFSEDVMTKIFAENDFNTKILSEFKRLSGNKSDSAVIFLTGDVNFTKDGACVHHVTAVIGKKLAKNDPTKFQFDDRNNFVFTTSNMIPNGTNIECVNSISESMAKVLNASVNRIVHNNGGVLNKETPSTPNKQQKVPFGSGGGNWL